MRPGLLVLLAVAAAAVLGTVFSVRSTGGSSEPERHRPVAPALTRVPAELPDGVRVIPEPAGFVATADAVAGRLDLPSGHLQVDDFWYGQPQVRVAVPPGRHQVRVTYANSVRPGWGDGAVALVTLVTDPLPPVFWKHAGVMGTDGGLGGFASAEAAKVMAEEGDGPLHDGLLDAIDAGRRNGIAELPVGDGLSLFCFDAGLGDGGYDVYVGSTADGRVSRVVFDGALLHLAWPGAGGHASR